MNVIKGVIPAYSMGKRHNFQKSGHFGSVTLIRDFSKSSVNVTLWGT